MSKLFRFLLFAVMPAISAAASAEVPSIDIQTTGTGPIAIFIGGIGSPAAVWDETVAKLSARHRCAVVSIAGFAGSAPMATPDFEAVKGAIVARIAREHWHKPVIVGHSFGGILALSLAASHPELFGKIIIVDALPFPMGQIAASPGPDALRQQARAFRDQLMALSDDDFRRQQTATLQTAITDPARLQPAVDWMLTSDRQTIAQAQYEMLTADLRAETTKITAPLLAIGTWRGREPFGFTHAKVEADLTAQYGRVAHHTIVITDTARHFVMLDEPDWLAAQIDGFATR